MEYEIIATLGPASRTEAIWREMLSAGVTAFRLNTSHLTLVQLREWLDGLAGILSGGRVPLVLDLQGSKWRLGDFSGFELVEGQLVRLVHAMISDGVAVLPVPHADFFKAVQESSGEIVLTDAKVSLVVEASGPGWVSARVARGGPISANKGITFTASSYRHEALCQKDHAILAETLDLEFVRYALSYVRDADEMASYRALFGQAYLIAKLERQPAVDQAAQVATSADELWLCRGDLGAELGLKDMAETVHRISPCIPDFAIPAILAGQVLEHMTLQPTPTRAEVCAIYDALFTGYRGFVLSDETAIGSFPVAACRIAALFKGFDPDVDKCTT